jgi:hypothetical protein
MKRVPFVASVTLGFLAVAVQGEPSASAASFGEEVALLKSHTNVIVLSDKTNSAKVAVVPAWQGRVMTSTIGGDAGQSFRST